MRITAFIVFILSMQVYAKSFGQVEKINLKMNSNFREVIEQLEKISGYRFVLKYDQSILNKKVDINYTNEKIDRVLDDLLKETGFTYKVIDRYIAIVPVSELNETEQQKTVSGKITDTAGSLIPGVSVVVKGTTVGTISDGNGNYSLPNVPADAVLQFSFVGMKGQEIKVGNQTAINVVLIEETIGIEEVVAIGYGNQSKRDLTGSISSVKGESIRSAPVMNAVQALQGRASGVSVIQQTGQPGAGFMVQVRGVGTLGNTDPLYVIDGIVGAGGGNNINPNDIESIDILKDASAAAIYGSRAANGVVLITTKRGKSGKPQITMNSYAGVQSVWKKMDLLNAKQYAEYANELQANGGQPAIPALQNPSALNDVTDWQEEIFRNGVIQDHNVNVSGGNDNGRYLFSAGYYDQQGILKATGFNRYSFRANSDFNIGKKLKFGESLQVSSTNTTGIDENSSYTLVNATYMPPYISVYDPTEIGGYNGVDVVDGTDPKNPLRILELTDRKVNRIGILGNAYLSYDIIEGLEYKFSVAMNYSIGTNYNYLPKYTSGERDINLYSTLSESSSRGNGMQVENTLNYKKTIGKHKFSALAGYTRQWYDGRDFGVNVREFPNSGVRVVGAATTIQSVSGSESDWALASLLGRVTYNYDSKYLVTANIRRDGSSRFAPENRYGVFPSFSAGWRISEENFMKSLTSLSDLKLKYGWGQLGMQEIGLYPYEATLTSTIKYVLGDAQTPVPAITQLALSNRGISWETTTQSNFGVDMGLFNNTVTMNLEYYVRKTDDMLIQVPVATSAGLKFNPTLNSGAVENRGIDFMLSYQKQINDFTFGISGNASYLLKNEVTSLGARTQPLFGNTSYQRSVVGESIGHFYGYKVDRIYQDQAEIAADNAIAVQKGWTVYQTAKTAPGDIRFKDVNNDGRITADDREIIGSPIPRWNYGMTLNSAYKNFDFSVMVQGMADFEIVNKDRLLMWESMTRAFNTLTTVLDRWTPTNPSTIMPRAVAGDPNDNKRFSDRWMESGAYARIKLVTLGYQIPRQALNSISNDAISSVRVYASANNLLTFTKTSTWDPEFTSNKGNDNMYRGVAESIYPQARTIMFGIQIGF